MAVKIQYRRGNAAAVPNLDIGEPGWDIDVKTGRIGDGTASPPRVMTTKSSGSFDYASVTDIRVARMILGLGSTAAASLYFNASDADTGFWSPGAGQLAASINGTTRWLLDTTGLDITGDIVPTGNVDGVKISKLNPAGVHGILVKTANNEYAVRNLVNGVGMAPFRNAAGAANPGGVQGDVIVQLADNPTVPGNAAIKIPAGTQGERAGVSPINGHLRYSSTKRSFEGFIDGEWRELVDYVEGKVVLIPSQFPSIQDAIDYFNNRSTKSIVYAQLDVGAHPVPLALSPSSRTNRVLIQGATPVDISLDTNSGTPVVAVSGSAGAWSVTYKLDSPLPDWLTVGPSGHSVIISDIEGSGDMPFHLIDGNKTISIPEANKAQIVIPVAKDANGAVIPISAYYQVNDYIMAYGFRCPVDIKRISSIVSTSVAGVNSAFGDLMVPGGWHRKFRKITGTLACTNSLTVNGTGTVFTQQLNPGDHLILLGTMQVVRVAAIVSDSQFTIDFTTSIAAGTGFTGHPNNEAVQVVTSAAHMGCFLVTAKNTVDRTITVSNTSQHLIPPPIRGIRRGVVKLLPSTVLFTANTFFNVNDNEYLGLKNLTVRYTGGSPTSTSIWGVVARNAYLTMDNVGFVNAPINLARNTSLAFPNILAVSGTQSTNANITVSLSCSCDGTVMIAGGGKGHGLYLAGSVMSSGRLITHGNGAMGAISTGNSQISAQQHKSSWNRHNGIRIDSMDKCQFGTVDYFYNGVFSPVGLAEGSLVPAIQIFSGSALVVSAGVGLVLSGSSHGVLTQQSGWASVPRTLVACFVGSGLRAHMNAQVYANGSHVRNCEQPSLLATYNAMITAEAYGITVDYGKSHGAQFSHNSFGVMHRTNQAYGAVGFIKRGPLAITGALDIAATHRSCTYTESMRGSLAQNQLHIYPVLNGVEASFGSVNYGSYAPIT